MVHTYLFLWFSTKDTQRTKEILYMSEYFVDILRPPHYRNQRREVIRRSTAILLAPSSTQIFFNGIFLQRELFFTCFGSTFLFIFIFCVYFFMFLIFLWKIMITTYRYHWNLPVLYFGTETVLFCYQLSMKRHRNKWIMCTTTMLTTLTR